MSVRLGPFEIEQRFAAGGMGEIWRGHHTEQGVPVAIKVMTGPNALLPEYQAEFRREVQAVARLNHPNVVQVYDFGALPDEVTELPGDLRPGSPYLVMEYASRGSLEADVVAPNWRDLKNVLMSTLSALAHAHSHNVVHRDIKPGNVLLGSHHESPPRIILTDFGIAHAADKQTRTDASEFTARSTEEATGTPRYMAPEQFMGRWREYGPWTDLYAVGIMAYQMACGRLPFTGSTFMILAMAHINNPLPELDPVVEVPDGFGQWVRRLCEKKPRDRFRTAADAAWALAQLDDSQLLYAELSSLVGESSSAGSDDFDDSTDMLPTRLDFAPPEAIRVFTMGRVTRGEQEYPDVPPLPVSWEESQPPAASLSLVGAGLGLFGLRTLPVVDRLDERSAIWDAFKTAYHSRTTRAVILRGLSGVGKTRLAEWFSRFVSEIGAGQGFRADHAEVPGPMHGLGWMLTTHFRTAGLDLEDMRERVTDQLEHDGIDDEFTARAMMEIVRSDRREAGDTTSRIIRFTSPDQRYSVVRKFLARRARERPVVVSFDDIHFSRDSLYFVKHALEPGDDTEDFGGLFILTVRDEVLQDMPEERAVLEEIAARDDVLTVRVDPMKTSDIATLVGVELGLSPSLAEDVARRSGGSPAFAIQLVEDWVKRGVLEVAGSSFVVREGANAELPTDMSTLWESRIDYLIKELSDPVGAAGHTTTFSIAMRPDDIRRALQLAAALGRDVDTAEWQHACEMSGVHLFPGLVGDMVRVRMATSRNETDFSFINDHVWEGLIQRSEEAGKWKGDNMLCARMLMSRYGGDQDGLAQRVGRHFLSAGAHRLAVTSLDEAYKRARSASDHRAISEICDLLELCYREMKLKPDSSRWSDLALRRAMPKIYSANPEEFQDGMNLMREAEAAARDSGKAAVLANILSAEAWASIYDHDIENGLFKGEEALELAMTTRDSGLKAACHRTLGHLKLALHDAAGAQKHFEEVLDLAPDTFQALRAKQSLAVALLRQGEASPAELLLEEVLDEAQELGYLMIEGYAHESLAMVWESRAEFERAKSGHTEALKIFEVIGTSTTLPQKARENIARVLIHLGEFDEAEEIVDTIQERIDDGGRGVFVHLDDLRLAIAAGRGDETRFLELMGAALQFPFAPTDGHVRTLLYAADRARDRAWAGAPELARATLAIVGDNALNPELLVGLQTLSDELSEPFEDDTDVYRGEFETARMPAPDFSRVHPVTLDAAPDAPSTDSPDDLVGADAPGRDEVAPDEELIPEHDDAPPAEEWWEESEPVDEPDPGSYSDRIVLADSQVVGPDELDLDLQAQSFEIAAESSVFDEESDAYELIEIDSSEGAESEQDDTDAPDVELAADSAAELGSASSVGALLVGAASIDDEADTGEFDSPDPLPTSNGDVGDTEDPDAPEEREDAEGAEEDDDATAMIGRPGASFKFFIVDSDDELDDIPDDIEADFEEVDSLTLRPRRPVPSTTERPSEGTNDGIADDDPGAND